MALLIGLALRRMKTGFLRVKMTTVAIISGLGFAAVSPAQAALVISDGQTQLQVAELARLLNQALPLGDTTLALFTSKMQDADYVESHEQLVNDYRRIDKSCFERAVRQQMNTVMLDAANRYQFENSERFSSDVAMLRQIVPLLDARQLSGVNSRQIDQLNATQQAQVVRFANDPYYKPLRDLLQMSDSPDRVYLSVSALNEDDMFLNKAISSCQ